MGDHGFALFYIVKVNIQKGREKIEGFNHTKRICKLRIRSSEIYAI